MSFNVNEFRSKMRLDGARPNLFEVYLNFPQTFRNDSRAEAQSQMRFKVKSAQLPGSTVGVVPVYYFGREMKFAGNRTFTDWTVQIINDEDFKIRDGLEAWMNAINQHESNTRDGGALTPANYTSEALVVQWGKNGNVIKEYSFVGMFPVDIAPIDLDWGSNDSIEEFSVTFAYQYWTARTTDGYTSKNITPER
jgi:hypothetical protein